MKTSRLMLFATAGVLLGMASCNETAPVQKADASDPASLSTRATNDSVALHDLLPVNEEVLRTCKLQQL